MPRITVTIPTRNRANLIGRAIRSLGRQTCRDFELLVGDDGCEDDTLAVVEREATRAGVAFRIINGGGYRRGTGGGSGIGQQAMRNRLISSSDSEFIAPLDDDDEGLPDWLEAELRMMEADARLALVGGMAVYRYEASGREELKRQPTGDMAIRWRAARSFPFFHSGLMMRRSHLPSQKPYDETMKRGEDALLWAQMTRREDIRFANVNKVVLIRHIHREQVDREVVQVWKEIFHERLIELHAEFLESRGAPKDAAVAKWLATLHWWKTEPASIPDPDRVRAVYGALDRWGLRVVGRDLARAIEWRNPWYGRLDLRGPASLKRRILAERAGRMASAVRRRFPSRTGRPSGGAAA